MASRRIAVTAHLSPSMPMVDAVPALTIRVGATPSLARMQVKWLRLAMQAHSDEDPKNKTFSHAATATELAALLTGKPLASAIAAPTDAAAVTAGKHLADSVAQDDLVDIFYQVGRQVAEVMLAEDGSAIEFGKHLSEVMTASDAMGWLMERAYADVMAASDAAAITTSMPFSESITASESSLSATVLASRNETTAPNGTALNSMPVNGARAVTYQYDFNFV